MTGTEDGQQGQRRGLRDRLVAGAVCGVIGGLLGLIGGAEPSDIFLFGVVPLFSAGFLGGWLAEFYQLRL